MSISWDLKASAHYIRYLASVIVDGIWLVSAMVDGKYKYLKMSAPTIKYCNISVYCVDDLHYILKSIKSLV